MTLQTRDTLIFAASMTLAIGAIAHRVLGRLERERTEASPVRVLETVARTHSLFDYRVGPTRVVDNPRSYPFEPAHPGLSVTTLIEESKP